MRLLVAVVGVLASPPLFACPAPPPPIEVVVSTESIAPDGGLILRIEGGRDQAPIRVEGRRERISFHLSVLKPKTGTTQVEIVRGGKVIKLPVTATQTLAAPKLTRVSSNRVELDEDMPSDAYTLVIYKIERGRARSIADGMPNKRVVAYSTGGKNCYGGFEPIYAGERIAVAWLDVHGKVSARSQTITAR